MQQAPSPVAADLAAAARALAASLPANAPPPELALRQPFDATYRTYVDFFPGVMAPNGGAELGAMGLGSRRAAHALLAAGLSREGYLLATRIMSLEEELRALEPTTRTRNPTDYGFHVFGEPGGEAPWGVKIEGHHLSLNFTAHGGQVRGTPVFLGANPAEVRSGPYTGTRTLAPHGDLGLALVGALTPAQRAVAVGDQVASGQIIPRGGAPSVVGDGGLAARDMDPAQRATLRALIETYAHVLRPELAGEELARIDAAGFDGLQFRWLGPTVAGRRHYYRIEGQTVLIEFDRVADPGQNDANHIHTIWHDPERDFGLDLLREHYEHGHRHEAGHEHGAEAGHVHAPERRDV